MTSKQKQRAKRLLKAKNIKRNNNVKRPDKVYQWVEVLSQCEICHGTGIRPTDEAVYPNEPHTASTGTQPCICQFIK